jgi:hypothetical protein
MDAHHLQPHYTPSSVGALMDTAFLRNAVMEANGDRRGVTATSSNLHWSWRHAIHAITAAFRRH